jgi:hypothetical protein
MGLDLNTDEIHWGQIFRRRYSGLEGPAEGQTLSALMIANRRDTTYAVAIFATVTYCGV